MAKGKGRTKEIHGLGKMVRGLRGDMTQLEFADAVDVKQAMISRYEADKEVPSPRVLLRMARFSGKSIEWLLTGSEELLQKAPRPDNKHVTRADLINSATQDLINTEDPFIKELAVMVNDLCLDRKRLERVLKFYGFIKSEK